ncbi:ArsC family transcription regulator [Lentilactobacillus diolivorans DSM 14421]|uniref:ArsC family transcription regulator n=2 Tax=Lentilactobacillus diolivorans TaxID=179838 RepID=A0A0R1SGG7_9LACO|nr:ArsC family transcription regulator [Lentilactobacillus diolivorans DSM 14421]
MFMLSLLITPSSTSSRKARKWLVDHDIPFNERNMARHPLNGDEIKELLSLTENGCWDLVSRQSETFKRLNVGIEKLHLSQFIELLVAHPQILKRPILVDHEKLQIGFNEDEIRSFLPRELRKDEFKTLLAKTC